MLKIILLLFCVYFMIGTAFLIAFLTGYLNLEMQNKKTGQWVEDKTIWMLSFCLYWPFLVWLLIHQKEE